VAVEAATSNEDIYPSELPKGLSTLLSHGPCSLLATHCRPSVEPPHTCSSSSPTWAPSNMTNQRAVKRAAIPVNCRGAQHVPVVRPPFTVGRILRPGFEFSPRAHAGPQAAVVDDDGRSSWRTIQGDTLLSSSQILATRPVVTISLPTSRLTCQVFPMSSCCACRHLE
jgi:hypothetical protein